MIRVSDVPLKHGILTNRFHAGGARRSTTPSPSCPGGELRVPDGLKERPLLVEEGVRGVVETEYTPTWAGTGGSRRRYGEINKLRGT